MPRSPVIVRVARTSGGGSDVVCGRLDEILEYEGSASMTIVGDAPDYTATSKQVTVYGYLLSPGDVLGYAARVIAAKIGDQYEVIATTCPDVF